MGFMYDAMRESFALLTNGELEQVRNALEDEIRARDDNRDDDLQPLDKMASMYIRARNVH